MKKSVLLSAAIALVALGPNTLPASAQQAAPVYSQSIQQTTTIPQSAAIVVAFPDGVQFKGRKRDKQPVTLMLVQPVLDSSGNVVAPANSLVQAQLEPVGKRGVQIRAESIIAGGQVISIQAVSSTIPAARVTDSVAAAENERTAVESSRYSAARSGAQARPDIDQIDTAVVQGGYSGTADAILGIQFRRLFGLDKVNVASFAPGSVWILKLEAPVQAAILQPAMLQQNQGFAPQAATPEQVINLQPAQQRGQPLAPSPQTVNREQVSAVQQMTTPAISQVSSPTVKATLDFRNARQYSNTVEQILASYRQGKVAAREAQAMIASADHFATTQLTQPLYPLAGIRHQVSQNFGFVYAIDR